MSGPFLIVDPIFKLSSANVARRRPAHVGSTVRDLEAEVARQFLAQVVEQARAQSLTSDEHFTVDGSLLEAWAGAKGFQRKDGKKPPPGEADGGNPTVNFHGEKRSNRTHASSTDPEAQMARKGEGKEAKLRYSSNLLVENRNGLIVNAMASPSAIRHC